MMIGAHPDDEDSALLAYLARGENARTAYLSLTRGDGGQNILGPELFESLGVIRTEELLQARRLDGAEQYFTRAFDYGFSKTLAEAKEKWPEQVILCDAVRAIRNFKPLVVIARFSGTPADGHGQHQYAGFIAPLAVKAAADPQQCGSAGDAWQVAKFYVEQGFRASAEPGLRVNTGKYDALLGRSYFEIAMEGRSQHKSQEQGLVELRGAQFSGLNLAENPKKETGIFDGLDISLPGIAANTQNSEEPLTGKLSELKSLSAKIIGEYDALEPQKVLPGLAQGCTLADKAVRSTRNRKTKAYLERKEMEFCEAARIAGGIQIEALADRETIVPGAELSVNAKVFFPETADLKVKEIVLKTQSGWQTVKTEAPAATTQGFFRRETGNQEAFFTVKVPIDAKATQPYWLESERGGPLYTWPNESDSLTLPFQPPLITAEVKMESGGAEITFTQPVQYRYADPIRGEVRRDLNVIPKVSVNFDTKLLVVSDTLKSHDRYCVLNVVNNTNAPVKGTAKLMLPKGLEAAAFPADFELKNKGDSAALKAAITVPRNFPAGVYKIGAEVNIDGGVFSSDMKTLSYPHIQTHRFYLPARVSLDVLDLKIAPVKIGYIMGSGEEVPEAIRQMGFDVTMLDAKELSGGDLSRFGTIVVGIRASETRPDFVANNQRLLDYVKNGGTLLVQYQRPEYAQRKLTPFPTQMGSRVVDENAKITILDPAHPVFNFPNKIVDADFAGWVQERNLYNFTNFDPAYKPLLEAHDAGEPEDKGGLVIAEIGQGKYVYCSYAFFRQLPAGVPGAYRLFANLLSLSGKK
jgi:LmbE family N-acetylglucosaminyl deacetylase